MADAFLFDIAHTILGRLGSLAVERFSMVFGVKKDLDKLQETLLTIRDVILDAEEKQAKDRQLTNWVEKLKEVLYDADDFLDEIEVNGLRRQLLFRNIKGKVSGFFSSLNPVGSRFRMAYKIKDIRERLDSIAADKAKFDLSVKVANGSDLPRTTDSTDSSIPDFDPIGRNDDKDMMVHLLMQNNGNEENLSVISVVGIGGLGKTTLAKLVYNDKKIIDHFQLRIWVSVSQGFDLRQLAKIIVSYATKKPCDKSLTFDQVETCLQDSLREKRFLLILDDVWNEDRPKWLKFRRLLRGGGEGSKIIVTTRSEYVASVMESNYTHKLKSLPDNDSLSLLVKYAFANGEEKHHKNLVKIGEDIVKKCKGVPLAIKTLGSTLFMKTNERDWLSVRDDEIWPLEQKEDDILPALKLSYNRLPYYLKRCFAYCSMFAKGQDIASIMLIQLWMAQGLIQSSDSSRKNEELEDIGTRYVKELCSRSLLEEVEAYGSFITFKMHDLVHDLAVSVAQNECSVPHKNFGNSTEKIRHVSLHNYSSIKKELLVYKLKKMRTLFLQHAGSGKESTVSFGGVISRFKYLRTLDLRHSRLEEVPLSIGDLKHLRYLDLSGNDNIKSLPTTICRLQNLQTLRIVLCTQLLKIPRRMKYLVSLRHLYITTRETSFLEKGFGCLTTLQSLSILRCENLTSLFEGAEKLIKLRTLVIGDCPRLTSLPRGMKSLKALENLMIINCEELTFSDWQDFQGFESLRSLMIGGLPCLSALPQFAYTKSNKLESVRISTCPGIVDLRTWLENASLLRKLEIVGCPKLTSLPDILSYLSELMVLKIDKCPELSRRCEKELGEDWPKISHFQEIYLNGVKL